ncbi:MAG: glutamine synthetase [Armatimonadetes bacterium]|nr:glutamine synthetase [Armatimonadota bacterium]
MTPPAPAGVLLRSPDWGKLMAVAVTDAAAAPMARAAEFLRAHDIRTVRAEWCDLHGVARGKRVRADHLLESGAGGVSFSSASIEMDLRGEIPWLDEAHLPWPNLYARPDPSTLRLVAFEPHTAAVTCDVVDGAGEPVGFSPRQVLRRVLAEAEARGFACFVGAELEFYLFRDAQFSLLPPGKLAYRIRNSPQEQEVVEAISRGLCDAALDCESIHAEDGPGQFEIVIRYGPALHVADAIFIARNMTKEVACRAGLVATFLPKPLPNESGSGFHIHQSLRHRGDNAPAFCYHGDSIRACPTLERFLAGQLAYTPDLTALLLPTINAYKRAATRRIRMNWGVDDRSASFRVLLRSEGFSLEHRVPGADANPYLFIAAALAAGLEGIDRQLETIPVIPGDPPDGDGDAPGARPLPTSLLRAVAMLRGSDVARRWLGDALVEKFAALKQDEAERFARAFTDWERREYLEYL